MTAQSWQVTALFSGCWLIEKFGATTLYVVVKSISVSLHILPCRSVQKRNWNISSLMWESRFCRIKLFQFLNLAKHFIKLLSIWLTSYIVTIIARLPLLHVLWILLYFKGYVFKIHFLQTCLTNIKTRSTVVFQSFLQRCHCVYGISTMATQNWTIFIKLSFIE